MPKGYWIAQVNVHDAEAYDIYRAANAKPFKDFGAKFIVRGGQQDCREGQWNSRTVVLEFPSYAEAIACFESPGYQQARDLRLPPVSESSMVIVEGHDP